MKRVPFSAVLAAVGVLTAGIAFAGAGVAGASVSQLVGPSWRVDYRADIAGSADFTDVEATNRSNAWAVGARFHGTAPVSGFAAHWNGTRWRPSPLPLTDFLPETVVGSATSNVWIFGFVLPSAGQPVTAGVALHLVSGRWRRVTLPPEPPNTWNQGAALMAVALGSNEVMVSAGVPNPSVNQTQIWQWTGTNWAGSAVPGILTSLSGSSRTTMWATTTRTAEGTPASVYRLISSTWTRQKGLSLFEGAVAVHSATDVWFAGLTAQQLSVNSGMANAKHWNGRSWQRFTVLPAGGRVPLVTDGRGGLWFGPLLHETGGKWYQPTSGFVFGTGCEPNGFAGALAGIPGTSATWAASGCTPSGSNRAQARISINGKL